MAAGLSLLLGPDGRARQQHDAAEKRGSVPSVVALLAPAGDDVETLVTTVAALRQLARHDPARMYGRIATRD